MEAIKLNLIPTGALPVVHASQYDDGRIFRADLYDGAEVYHLDGTETISCELKKPDGNIVTLAVTNTSESFIEIQTTEQACAVAGESLAEVKIEKGDDKIGSLNFILSVERSPIEGGISSASEINNLWTQVDGMVADALATQYDSANVIFDNEPTEGHGIPYTVTSEGIGIAIDDALEMTEVASGAIATFESEYALPLRDLEIEINAVQESGTPTPSSPKLISGFTGANIRLVGSNLTDEQWELGTIDGTTGANTPGSTSLRTTNYIPIEPNTTYYFYIGGTGTGSTNPYLYDQNKQYIGRLGSYLRNQTFTTPSNAYYIRLGLQAGYGTTYNNNISINYPATDTAYHAYNANSTTTAISWQSEAGTVYGGSLDVTSGKLTVTHGSIDLGDYTWSNASGNLSSSSGIATDVKAPSANTQAFNGLCSVYEVSARTGISDKQIAVQTNGNIVISDTGISGMTGAQVKTYVTGFILVYELATPVTYQLTPTQISAIVGTNNVFTDTNGDTILEYYTKRGEQTVRIAEGVAVDVINNKSIDTLTTTDKTVKGAINELDGIIDGIKAIETLFVTNTIATSTTEYSTYNSRKFSDYDFYLFKIGASALDVRRTVILSKADWISGASINEVMLHGSTASTASSYTVSSVTAGYHSDTSFDANAGGAGTLNYLTIHGIRKN